MLPVFEAVGAPGAFRSLGGVTVWWRVTIHGLQGEPIGLRDITHMAEAGQPDRDRLEHGDGRVFGRAGAAVFAERQAMPWPSLVESAGHHLQLFGEHLRFPFAFADGEAFWVVGTDDEQRGSASFRRIHLERRPQTAPRLVGPQVAPPPVDRFELVCDQDGLPREWVHEFANSGQVRCVQLDDWRLVGAVRLPFRRTYVDEGRRPTTTLEILRVETGVGVGERDFRLR